MDLISVIIPTHNRPELLKRAVRSVLEQDYINVELIISDDASDFCVESLIRQTFTDNFHEITIIKSSLAKGACHARNRGIEKSKGKYVTFLDDDDQYRPNHLSYLFSLFSSSNFSFVSSSVVEKSKHKLKKRHFNIGKVSLDRILHGNCIGNNIFTLRERLILLGGFDVDFPALQDYELMIRLIHKYGPAYKCKNDSYIQHTDHDSDRISHSSIKRLNALSLLTSKHSAVYDGNHLKSLALQKIKFSNNKNIIEVLKNINLYNLTSALSLIKNIIRNSNV